MGITQQAAGMRSAYFILDNKFVPQSGGGARGGGRWRWLVDLVLMLEQKMMRKGTFFSRWAVRSAVIVKDQKNGILVGKG